MSISTHVLDAAAGRPAAGVPVVLERRAADDWTMLASASTDGDGRIGNLLASTEAGVHRLRFDVERYAGPDAFFPEVVIVFRIEDPAAHHHVPLLLSPFAYSTYRGS
ncbi:MAG TPA: hydroxyisourate hydrolase [Jatrophihabitans sp.]|jgi:5-hydroxyisourate hydrolase|nr:hydroxyisourate hydrolase [Jatrophihabitans sp.]